MREYPQAFTNILQEERKYKTAEETTNEIRNLAKLHGGKLPSLSTKYKRLYSFVKRRRQIFSDIIQTIGESNAI